MMQLVLSGWISSSVCALARLGVPDHIGEVPRSAGEIAPEVGAQPDLLYRLMRATSAVGVLAETPDHKFAHTPLSRTLRSDAVPCMRDVALFNSDEWHVRGWEQLDQLVKTGVRPGERLYGVPDMFEYLAARPVEGGNFNRGMTNLSSSEAPLIADLYDFSGIGTLTDVGGGHGLLLSTILQKYPRMQGVLADIPAVIETAAGGPTEAVKDRVKLVGVNMFESVPAGSDAYIMKYIIHDWMDDRCLRILKACRAGVNPGGKLLVVDQVVPGPGEFHMSKITDLEMALFPGGKERTEAEFRELFAAAGWKLTRILPTPLHLSIVEGVAA